MAVESAADRAAFFATDDFGTAATYRPQVGGPQTVNGIFDAPFRAAELEAEVGVETTSPTFACRTADLPHPEHGAVLSVDGTDYVIVGVHPDGTGVTLLMLRER